MAKLGRPPEYNDDLHPLELFNLMSEGWLDVQVYGKWGISRETFYKWLRTHEELKEAHDRGMPRCESVYIKKAQDATEKGDDKGFKYYISIMNNKFSWERGAKNDANTTNINIGSMNVLQQQSRVELLDYIKTSLDRNKDILEVKLIEVQDSDGSSEKIR